MIAPLGTSVVSLTIIAVVHGLYSWVGLPISFCPLAVCTESLMLRAGSQGGGVQVSSISSPPSHESEVCDLFSHRDLPSCSERQPRAVAIVHIVWGVFLTPLDDNSKRDLSFLSQRLLFNHLWLLGRVLSPHVA